MVDVRQQERTRAKKERRRSQRLTNTGLTPAKYPSLSLQPGPSTMAQPKPHSSTPATTSKNRPRPIPLKPKTTVYKDVQVAEDLAVGLSDSDRDSLGEGRDGTVNERGSVDADEDEDDEEDYEEIDELERSDEVEESHGRANIDPEGACVPLLVPHILYSSCLIFSMFRSAGSHLHQVEVTSKPLY